MSQLKRRPLYLSSLLLLVSILATIWHFGGLRLEPQQRNLGYGEEARRNPFLAAQMLLERHGHSVAYARNLEQLSTWLPQGPATLIIAASEHPAEWQIHLWRWVKRGGHLIVNVQGDLDQPSRLVNDPWLVHLNFSARLHDDRTTSRWFTNGIIDNTFRCNTSQPLSGQINQSPFNVANRNWLTLNDVSGRASWQLGPKTQANILQYPVGSGKVTVVSDLTLWTNRNIACADHAFLLTQLVNPKQPVWLLYHADMPALPALLWRHAPAVILVSLLLLLSWLWLRSARLGPIAASKPTARRELQQHLYASAAFNWRHGLIGPYLQGVQQSIKQRMERHHPSFAQLTPAQQHQALADYCQLSNAQTALAMSPTFPQKTTQLVSTVQLLQKIRNRL